jgi:hypothetical protein
MLANEKSHIKTDGSKSDPRSIECKINDDSDFKTGIENETQESAGGYTALLIPWDIQLRKKS